MRIIRERAKIFNLNLFKIPKFTFMPLNFNPDPNPGPNKQSNYWLNHEKLVLRRAKLNEFYENLSKSDQKSEELYGYTPRGSRGMDPFGAPKQGEGFISLII
jgi:hypothetical protein